MDTELQQETIPVPIRRLPGAEDVALPSYQSAHAAGMDLHAAVPAEQPVAIKPGQIALIPCGFAMAVPVGYEAQIRPRSGLAVKHGLSMPNTPGTIDSDYRGEVKVPIINHGSEPVQITRHMRIAQMLIKPVPRTAWLEVDELPETDRGEGGFGHTGR
ncbi:dUTP diphosphatase [Phycisphaerales bacterium AB-hyl4]|uniref:Deoxyuridine 5'-triphosphate nucleotidohydrolase n=1 Tax=Natronomicrosphaera hydrolytica TaxID=3242702 RepID=A0ABV4U857_9BACT